MEIFLSAVLGELASRSINLLISRRSARPTALDVGDSLQSALFRAQVIVDEAMGRHIANQAMLQQLDMLRDAMHRACYVLDTSRCQSHDEEDAEDQVVNHSLSLQKLTSLKGISFASNRKTPPLLEQLQESLQNLSSMILDARELVVFFRSYPPRLYSQPYSMHLLLGTRECATISRESCCCTITILRTTATTTSQRRSDSDVQRSFNFACQIQTRMGDC